MALTVVSFLWGDKYGFEDVAKLRAGLRRHLKKAYRFLLLTEPGRVLPHDIERHNIEDPELLEIKGCFARLRLFDPQWQKKKNIEGKIVSIDLDVVVTGKLNQIFERNESFVVLGGANGKNPCPFNGSIWMLDAGQHANLWYEFSLDAAKQIKFYQFPDDQGWFWHMLPNAATWQVGKQYGIYAFEKPGWPGRLPSDAKLVVFPGWRSPKLFQSVPWINEHWIDR